MEILFDLISFIAGEKIINFQNFDDLKKKQPQLYYFFIFLKKEKNMEFFIKIYENTNFLIVKYYNNYINKNLKINSENYCKLQVIFAIKSLKKSNFEMIKEIKNNITVDNILDAHLSYEKKYWIFEKRKIYPYCKIFRKEIFKFYSILNIKNIIKEKHINDGLKTYKQWIIDFDDFEFSEIEKFKISYTPFILHQIDDRFFLFSNFFNLTTEMFKENIHSSKRFKLKEKIYLENLCKISLIFDEENFNMIYNRKKDEIQNVDEKIKSCVTRMKIINENIEKIKFQSKQMYIANMKKIIIHDMKKINEINEFFPFKIYLIGWLNTNFSKNEIGSIEINIIWKEIINDIIIHDIYQISEEWMVEILTKKNLRICEIILEKKDEKNNIENINEIEIENFLNMNFKKIIEIYKNLNLTREGGEDYRKKMIEIREYEDERIQNQIKLSKLYYLNNLGMINFIKNEIKNKKLFFPFFYDFRGRMYIHSSIGVTNFPLSRYFFHYGWYNKDEIKKLSEYDLKEANFFNDKISYIMKKNKIFREEKCIKYGIFWALIAIGKEFIDKTKIYNTIDEIFESGYNKIINENIEIDDEKWIIIEYYKNIILSFKKKNIPKKFIHKDATASFIQNTIRIVGAKDSSALEYSNLKNRKKWYDTYALALFFWKNTLKIEKNHIIINEKYINTDNLKYFIRKTIKKPIMTDSYEATYLTQWEYFRRAVKEEFSFKLEHKSEVEILFKNLITFLDKYFWDKYFLASNSNIMIEYILNITNEEKKSIISSFDSEANMIYYKFKNKTIDVILRIPDMEKTYRKTKIIRYINEEEINFRKLKNAIKPNWVHFSDAYLTRQINTLLDSYLLTIHDCFLVDSLSVSIFIDKANEGFRSIDNFSIAKNKELFKEINSLFIFF